MKDKVLITNRKAYRDFQIDYTIECGIALLGQEVKSLREGKANLSDSFARAENGEVFLYNFHINPYKFASSAVEPKRTRKLLLHKKEIRRLASDTQRRGFTIVPLKVYFKENRLVKIEIALAKGKKQYDKREDLKKKAIESEIAKELKRRR